MKSLPIIGATRVLGENQPEYSPLHIFDHVVEGSPVMSSHWEPNEEERSWIAAGGTIELHILGEVHPPVRLLARKPVDFEEGEA